MKIKSLLIAVAALCSGVSLVAAEKIVGGPKGGRLLEVGSQKAEFFMTKDRKAEVIFYDASLEPTQPGAHVVAITAEPKSGRTPIELEKTETGFISKAALSEAAEPYRVVVQLREKAGAAPKNYRIDLDLANCGGCDRAEYACTCHD